MDELYQIILWHEGVHSFYNNFDEISVYKIARRGFDRRMENRDRKNEEEKFKDFRETDKAKRKFMEAMEQKFYDYLNYLSKINYEHRRLHKMYQDKVKYILGDLESKLDNLHFKSRHIVNDLEKIEAHCRTGKYMANKKVDREMEENEEDLDLDKIPFIKDKLERFFKQEFDPKIKQVIDQREKRKALEKQKSIVENNFSVFGKYPLYYLKDIKVLVDIKLKGEKIDNLFKKSSLIFFDTNGDGLFVSLVYIEKRSKKGNSSSATYEAVLDSFKITTRELLDLRRRKLTKTTCKINDVTFNIFEFVNFINRL